MDFALILVVATVVSGLIWAFDVVVLKPRRITWSGPDGAASEPVVVEYARTFFPILVLVVVLRSFLFEPFRIPSASMMPTLLEGDFIVVNKFAYGLRLPVVNTKILDIGEPERGDVMVFRLPSDPRVNYIKRVVGLPGDVVAYDAGSKQLSINGENIELELVGPYEGSRTLQLGREQLGEREHELLHTRGILSRGGTYQVPEGHYFVMGDHRDNSQDSRFNQVRFVPEYRLVGRAERIWMNFRWPGDGGPMWGRIGMGIR